jgi:Na+/H+ antiporter NhaC
LTFDNFLFVVEPVINKPISFSSVFFGSKTSTILPSYITAMRSDKDKISSKSAEMSKIAFPLSLSFNICWCTNSIEPTSNPRVG